MTASTRPWAPGTIASIGAPSRDGPCTLCGVHKTVALLILACLFASAGCSGDEGAEAPIDEGSSSTATVASSRPTGCEGGEVVPPGTQRIEIPSGDLTREVERVVPPSYDGATPHPLLLSLHGFSSTIEQQDLFSSLPEQAGARGYLLLTPQAAPATLPVGSGGMRAPYWNLSPDDSTPVPGAQDDITFLTDLIDATMAELCVDESRIYITGNSNGGGMSAALACSLEGRVAAIAPVSGINLAPPCDAAAPVSVIAFHGDADPLVPYEGEVAAGDEPGNPPVEESVGDFAAVAGCDAEPEQSSPHEDIALRQWTGCHSGLGVELYTVLGGGHTWPGMLNYVDPGRLSELGTNNQELVDLAGVDLAAVAGHMTLNVEATAEMLDFFDAHPRP